MTWFGPGWIPRSTPFRLVVPFYPAACCTMGGGGLNVEQEVPLNQVLLQRGGPDAVAKWVAVKQQLTDRLAGRCCVFGNIVLCLTGFVRHTRCVLAGSQTPARAQSLAERGQLVVSAARHVGQVSDGDYCEVRRGQQSSRGGVFVACSCAVARRDYCFARRTRVLAPGGLLPAQNWAGLLRWRQMLLLRAPLRVSACEMKPSSTARESKSAVRCSRMVSVMHLCSRPA